MLVRDVDEGGYRVVCCGAERFSRRRRCDGRFERESMLERVSYHHDKKNTNLLVSPCRRFYELASVGDCEWEKFLESCVEAV